jgi:hypothetical protein
VNGEAILQVWRIGANMLNNQYLTVDKELSNSRGVGQDPVRRPINVVMGLGKGPT